MIYDALFNFQNYVPVHPLFHIVLNFIEKNDLSKIEIGKIDISQGVYAVINEYKTGTIQNKFIECHKQYIDIQIVAAGIEQIGICNKKECKIREPYIEAKDYEKLEGQIDLLTLKPGYFIVLYPHDGHMPGLKIGNKEEQVKKVVFKIPI